MSIAFYIVENKKMATDPPKSHRKITSEPVCYRIKA